MNQDYTIVIHTDTPASFDQVTDVLQGNWTASMKNHTTGDHWHKQGTARPSALTDPASFSVVEEPPC